VTVQLGKALGLTAANQTPNRGVISVTLSSKTVTEKRSCETALFAGSSLAIQVFILLDMSSPLALV